MSLRYNDSIDRFYDDVTGRLVSRSRAIHSSIARFEYEYSQRIKSYATAEKFQPPSEKSFTVPDISQIIEVPSKESFTVPDISRIIEAPLFGDSGIVYPKLDLKSKKGRLGSIWTQEDFWDDDDYSSGSRRT